MSVGEAKALDEAAEMLEQQRVEPKDIPGATASPTPQPTG